MDLLSIVAVGWLMSSLVNKAVTALLEAWAKRVGLANKFKNLKDQLRQLGALLTSTSGLRTNNSFLEELVENLQQLVYQAENLLDELDYYRLQDQIQQRAYFQLIQQCCLVKMVKKSCLDQTLPGCNDTCGAVSIPHTFGFSLGCHFRAST